MRLVLQGVAAGDRQTGCKGTCDLNDALTDFAPSLCFSNVKKTPSR